MATSKNIDWKVESITLDRNHPFQDHFITAELSTPVPPKSWSLNELAMDLQDHLNKKSVPEIKNVIFNDPATIVLWADDTKTVVKCQEGDKFNPETGLAMAIVKRMYGNTGKYCEIFKKWVPEVESEYPNIMLGLKLDGDEYVRALERIREVAKKTTMSWKEAANTLYAPPKKLDSEEIAKLAEKFDRVNAASPSEIRTALKECEKKKELEWTPTAQDKPTKKGEYLVYDKFVDSVYVYEYSPTCDKDVSYWRNYITHWMPCPKAPVEKKG
jgi:hypothetical protein